MRLKKLIIPSSSIYFIFLVLITINHFQEKANEAVESRGVIELLYWQKILILLAGPLNMLWMDPATMLGILGYEILIPILIVLVLVIVGGYRFDRNIPYKIACIIGLFGWFLLGVFSIAYYELDI